MNNAKILGIQKPSLIDYLKEPVRIIKQYSVFEKVRKEFSFEKTGDGHPVLVLPGFQKSKRATFLLTRFLKKNGYQAQVLSLGLEEGKLIDIDNLLDEVEKIYKERGEKISLIGWSLGGVFARQLAKKQPEYIRQVITLSAPFGGIINPDNAKWLLALTYNGLEIGQLNPNCLADVSLPALVPTTAFYSPKDELVAWETCMEKEEDEIHQNIEIDSKHKDVVFNKKALPIILDRLQYREENWRKYGDVKVLLNKAYPEFLN